MNKSSELIDNDYICCATNDKHLCKGIPLIQQCGKLACEECLNDKNEIYCYSCKQEHIKLPRIEATKELLGILKDYKNEFNRLIENRIKYNELKEILDENYLKTKFNEKIELIRDEIDLRVDSLKVALDEYRDNLLRQLDKAKEQVNERILSNDIIQKLKLKYNNVSINEYSEYEMRIKQFEYELDELKSKLPEIYYETSEFEFTIDLIGDLTVINRNGYELSINHFNGDLIVPIDKSRLAFKISEQIIGILNFDDGKCVNILNEETSTIYCLTQVLDNHLASGNYDSTIKIWNLNTNECIKTLIGHSNSIRCLKKLPQNILASGSDDKTIKLWNLDSFNCIHTFEGHIFYINCLEYLTNDRLISGSRGIIKVWDTNTLCLRGSLDGHEGYINCLTGVSNSNLASGGIDGCIIVWDLHDYSCIGTLEGHISRIECLICIKNNKLVSCELSGTMKIWNLDNYLCFMTFDSHKNSVRSLIHVSNNKLASFDFETYKIWNLESFNCIKTVKIDVNQLTLDAQSLSES